MKNNPLFSIIIPNFNRFLFIVKCLGSIAAQPKQNYEVVIVDDCSTDNSADLIKQTIIALNIESKVQFLINTINEGISAARNKGLLYCRGQYICW